MSGSSTSGESFDTSTLATPRRGAVLMVDDDVLGSRAYARTLAAAGYAVDVSSDARQAVARFTQRSFDVIISDVRMPGMSGLELLRAIRERDADVPVIIMTASPEVETASEALEHGAFNYLIKPVSLTQLERVVARAVRLHHTARARREVLERSQVEGRRHEERPALELRFAHALSTLHIGYQPILSWSRRSLHAFEALARSAEPTLTSSADLFEAAERLQRLPVLGEAIRRQVAQAILEIAPPTSIMVNIHPADLLDPALFDANAPLSACASRIILEITARAPLGELSDLMERVGALRRLGYRIALDDLGAGYAGLTSLAQLEPEVVKVDMSIVRGVDRSATKQKVLGSIVTLCRDLGIDLVAEGIETASERATIVGLGGDLCQDSRFWVPGTPPPEPNFD